MVRSTFGIRSAGQVFALLLLALTGCGTIPEGVGERVRAPLLELPRTSAGGESAVADTAPRGTGEMAAAPAAEPGAPAEPRDEAAVETPPGARALATEAPDPAFVPV